MHPLQIQIYKSMSPEQKLRIAMGLHETARKLKFAGLKNQHPDWDKEQLQEKVREIFLYATT
jgi:hypothetical protein